MRLPRFARNDYKIPYGLYCSPLKSVLIEREPHAKLLNLGLYCLELRLVRPVLQRPVDEARYCPHLSLFHALCRGGRDAYPYAAREERATGLKGYGVLVDGYTGLAQRLFRVLAGYVLLREVHEHEVVVGAAGHQRIAPVNELLREHLCVREYLLLVLGEGLIERLFEGHGLRGDYMHERAPCMPGNICLSTAFANSSRHLIIPL